MRPFDLIKPDDIPPEAEELQEERTARTKTFDLHNGNHRTIGHIGLLHYPGMLGDWKDCDLSARDDGDRFMIDTGYFTADLFKDDLVTRYTNAGNQTIVMSPDFGSGLKSENPSDEPAVRFKGSDVYGADARIAPARLDMVTVIGRDTDMQGNAPIIFRWTVDQPPGFSSDLTVEEGGQDSEGRRAKVRATEVNRRTINTRSETREEVTMEYEVRGKARRFDEQRNPVWERASYPVEVRT